MYPAHFGYPPDPREIDPPYPRWNISLILVIEEAVLYAWQMYVRNQGVNLTVLGEVEITAQLTTALSKVWNRRQVTGFNHRVFSEPIPGASYYDHSGNTPNKTPDIIVKRIDTPNLSDTQLDGYFIECKKLDVSKGVSLYIQKGVLRFVDGHYAWAVPNAGMLGYIKHRAKSRRSIIPDLSRALPLYDGTNGVPNVRLIAGPTQCPNNPDVYWTDHQRTFPLPGGGSPGPIAVRHLWLTM